MHFSTPFLFNTSIEWTQRINQLASFVSLSYPRDVWPVEFYLFNSLYRDIPQYFAMIWFKYFPTSSIFFLLFVKLSLWMSSHSCPITFIILLYSLACFKYSLFALALRWCALYVVNNFLFFPYNFRNPFFVQLMMPVLYLIIATALELMTYYVPSIKRRSQYCSYSSEILFNCSPFSFFVPYFTF